MPAEIKSLVIVGASGHLGEAVLPEFLKSSLQVSVLARPDSKASFPEGVTIIRASTSNATELEAALKGQDAIVSLLSDVGIQEALLEAAKKAGVKWFIPSEFGHDTSDPLVMDLPIPLFKAKDDFRKKLDESGLGWTGIIPGMFFDWGMKVGFLGFDFKTKTANLWDEGAQRFPTTNTTDIGRAIVTLLSDPTAREKSRNKLVYIYDYLTSQKEILAAVEKATGEKWTVNHVESGPVIKNAIAGLQAGDWGMHNVGPLVLCVPLTDGAYFGGKWRDWTKKAEDETKILLPGKIDTMEETIKRITSEQ